MSENRSRFVLLCQQSLAFGLVAAITAPAANLVTLDIVSPGTPGATVAGRGGSTSTGADDAATAFPGPVRVATAPVRPRVRTVALSRVTAQGLSALRRGRAASGPAVRGAARLAAVDGDPETDDLTVLSAPQPVDGLGTVGVTWDHHVDLPDRAITLAVRTQQHGAWSAWQKMPYHEEEGPDPASAEGSRARPGTDPVYVGAVDDVQVKAVTDSGVAPDGMRLTVVDPGAEAAPTVEDPAIDTGELDLRSAATGAGPDAQATLSAGAVVTAKPRIFSRAQWGADERMRDASSLHYGEVHAGFVHHTVNANNYTAAQVPAIIRGIYAFHTQSRGWSDVGYNFLVDRFGRIWEGRYGGVDRPVVGAHTLGYNDDAFAMSAIGNFETARPPAAMIDAYGRLFAWKLSLHGVRASSTRQWVTKRYLPAINGHRDVGQTACPGRFLYAKIPAIRSLAASYQRSFAGRQRMTNLAGSTWPDLVVRDRASKLAYLVRTGGGNAGFGAARTVSTGWSGRDLVTSVRDVTGDRKDDLLARNAATLVTSVYPGDGAGHFGAAIRPTTRFRGMDLLTGVGDWNGDGKNDVVGRNGTNKRLYLFYGDGTGRLGATYRLLSGDWRRYTSTVGAGDWNGDHHPDLMARTSTGRLVLVPGVAAGRIGTPILVSTRWSGFDLLSGLTDVTNDGRPDLVGRFRSTRTIYLFSANGRGGYARLGPYPNLAGPTFLTSAGQVAGTSARDVLGRDSAGRLVVFTNNGRRPVERVASTGQVMSQANLLLNVGDWNGDGRGDVVTRSATTGGLFLYRGNGAGRLSAPVRIGTGFGSVRLLAAVGDITGDGFPDLMGQPSGSAMRIYPGNGALGLRASYVAHAAITGTQQIGLGLWDGDGSPDSLARRSDGALLLYPGNGPGGLTGAGRSIATVPGAYDWVVGLGRVNADSRPDVVARERATGALWLLPGTSTGLGPRTLLTAGLGRFDLAG